jgi:hypothetical protein
MLNESGVEIRNAVDAALLARERALSSPNHPTPRVINVDKNPSYPPVIEELKTEDTKRCPRFERGR